MKKKNSGNGFTTVAVVIGVIGFSIGLLVTAAALDRETFMYGAAAMILAVFVIAIVCGLIDKRKKKKAATEKQKQREEELKNLDTEKFDKLIDEIKARTAQTAYRIKMSDGEDIGITDSKFGGLPYWPNNMDYPTGSNGDKLVLLAQINFDKEKLRDYRLPKHGLLQFFILSDDLSGADFEDPFSQENFRIVYHAEVDGGVNEERVRALSVKANTDFDGSDDYLPSYNEMRMSFEEMTDCMTDCVDGFDELVGDILKELFDEELVEGSVWKSFNDAEFEYINEALNEMGWGHKMLGYPSFTQWDPRKDGEYRTLLLQLDSQDDIMWGDSGVANFFINEKDLEKLDFSNVMYTWDCY